MSDLTEEVNQDPDFCKRYELGPRLGSGGMGTVHRGTHRLLGRPVAVKFMRPEHLLEEVPRQRFLSEARTAAGLIHPNVCVVLDFGFAGRVPFLVTELVEGQSLQNLTLKAQPRLLAPALTLTVVRQLLDGLEAIHALGVVHRDLKPANVVVTPDERAKILDFGLAKPYSAQQGTSGLTLAGTVVGTPAYISPEQGTSGTLAPSSDLYALTVMLYEIVVGHLPFRADNAQDVIKMHVYEPPHLPDRLIPPVRAVLARGLAKRPRERYQSATEMRADLELVQAAVDAGLGFLVAAAPPPEEPPTCPGPLEIAGQTLPRAAAVSPSTTAATAPVRAAPPAETAAASPPSRPPPGERTMTALAVRPERPWPFLEVGVGALVLVAGLWMTSRPQPPVEPPPPPASVEAPTTWYGRFLVLRREVDDGKLAGLNRGLAGLSAVQPEIRTASLEPKELDEVLMSALEIASGTTSPASPAPDSDPDYLGMFVKAGHHMKANQCAALVDLVQKSRLPAMHSGSALDWMRGTALVGAALHAHDLGAAPKLLAACVERHGSRAPGGWAAELLAALHAAAGDQRAADKWRLAGAGPPGPREQDWRTLANFNRQTVFRVKSMLGRGAAAELRGALSR